MEKEGGRWSGISQAGEGHDLSTTIKTINWCRTCKRAAVMLIFDDRAPLIYDFILERSKYKVSPWRCYKINPWRS